ncbi:hypothetical protein [Streptomyces sp. B1I3]|uniref:hypothetical protein n=1 Tax=Streptomyces sp. B1I3 TaxID=3042264 RepID=UPI002783517A|nr:hypothetical protein [Streptomyces sp. B1I3]MDQ0795564.1 cytochrome c-type biogenesis protein CcmH/NrfG [Streptomyces sp. B1I3]
MADEPSNGELGRLIQALRDDVREDLGNLNGRLDSFVSQDVYTIEKTQINARVTTLETQRERDADRIVATRRWMIGVVITVVVALLPYLAMTVKGAGA